MTNHPVSPELRESPKHRAFCTNTSEMLIAFYPRPTVSSSVTVTRPSIPQTYYTLLLAQSLTKSALTVLQERCRDVGFKTVYLGGSKLAGKPDMLISGPMREVEGL